MYKFILYQYQQGRLTEAQVNSYVPKWISQDEADKIIQSEIIKPPIQEGAYTEQQIIDAISKGVNE